MSEEKEVEKVLSAIRECMYRAEVLECALYDAKASENSKRRVTYIKDLLTIIHSEVKGEKV